MDILFVSSYYENSFLYICVLISSSANLEIKLQNYRVYTYSTLFYHAKLSREFTFLMEVRISVLNFSYPIYKQSTNFVLLLLNFFLIILFFLMLL